LFKVFGIISAGSVLVIRFIFFAVEPGGSTFFLLQHSQSAKHQAIGKPIFYKVFVLRLFPSEFGEEERIINIYVEVIATIIAMTDS
jgi:hypothetical protein